MILGLDQYSNVMANGGLGVIFPPYLPSSLTQGKPDVAIPLCKKAVHELEQKKGRDNPDVAAMLNIMAVIYRYSVALSFWSRIVSQMMLY